jgi:hypothetical protein
MLSYSIMCVIGSAVPESVRDLGLLVCWYVVNEGVAVSPPLLSRIAAEDLSRRLAGALAA